MGDGDRERVEKELSEKLERVALERLCRCEACAIGF